MLSEPIKQNIVIKDFDDVDFHVYAEYYEKDGKKIIYVQKNLCKSNFEIQDLFYKIRFFISENMGLKPEDYIYIEKVSDDMYVLTMPENESRILTSETIKKYR